MEGSVYQAVRGFGLKCRGVVKEKSFHICDTDAGLITVQKITGSRDDVLFRHAVKERLCECGFGNTDRYLLSAEGLPYAVADDGAYTSTVCFSRGGKEADFGADILDVVKAVAEMQKAVKQCSGRIYDSFHSGRNIDAMPAAGEYGRVVSRLSGYKKMVAKQPGLSDFDVLFLKCCDFYRGMLDMWHETAQTAGYGDMLREGEKLLCHGSLQEDTVVIKDGPVYITGFAECGFSHPLCDLAAVIKRHIKRPGAEYVPLGEILAAYCEINPLTSAEFAILRGLLLFPDRFIKICQRHYAKRRTWIPAAFMTRMEEVAADKERRLEYIESYFSG